MHTVQFNATGHQNVRAAHRTTLEFTKSSELHLQGDCIIAVNADFDPAKIKELATACERIKVTLRAGFSSETIEAIVNKRFEGGDELVIRIGEFDSARTLGIRADKAALHLNRTFVEKLKNPRQKLVVKIEGI